MSQDKVPDDDERFFTVTEEDEKKATEFMIQRAKEMMTKYKGLSWGDQSAQNLFQSLLDKVDLPDHDVDLPYDTKTQLVTLAWTKPKPARVDVLISSIRPEASVYLGKSEPEPAVSYEETLDKLKQYFTQHSA